jgi:hypothetical protein
VCAAAAQILRQRLPNLGAIAGKQAAAVPEPGRFPLSTAEKRVFVLEDRRLGAGDLFVISGLSRFWRPRPAAEIERGLHLWQRTGSRIQRHVPDLPNSA